MSQPPITLTPAVWPIVHVILPPPPPDVLLDISSFYALDYFSKCVLRQKRTVVKRTGSETTLSAF